MHAKLDLWLPVEPPVCGCAIYIAPHTLFMVFYIKGNHIGAVAFLLVASNQMAKQPSSSTLVQFYSMRSYWPYLVHYLSCTPCPHFMLTFSSNLVLFYSLILSLSSTLVLLFFVHFAFTLSSTLVGFTPLHNDLVLNMSSLLSDCFCIQYGLCLCSSGITQPVLYWCVSE